MTVLAALGDTWGIPGPTFLGLYLLAAVVIVVGALVHRRRIVIGQPVAMVDQLGPQQVAYLNGGDLFAVLSSVGGLRSNNVIGVRGDRRLAVGAPLPAGATPLDQAVHHAARRNLHSRELVRDEWVARALVELRQDLQRRGLALSPDQRRTARRGSRLLFGLLALGGIRLVAGLANIRPVGFLAMALVGVTIAAILLSRVPWRTRAADTLLHDLQRRNAHLAPASSPATPPTSGGGAMGVALFGAASLWPSPDLRRPGDIQHQTAPAAAESPAGRRQLDGSAGAAAVGGAAAAGSAMTGRPAWHRLRRDRRVRRRPARPASSSAVVAESIRRTAPCPTAGRPAGAGRHRRTARGAALSRGADRSTRPAWHTWRRGATVDARWSASTLLRPCRRARGRSSAAATRSREAVDAVCANVAAHQAQLPVPIALEPIAALFDWPDDELEEAAFLTEILDRTDRYSCSTWPPLSNARNRGTERSRCWTRCRGTGRVRARRRRRRTGWFLSDTHPIRCRRRCGPAGELCDRHRPRPCCWNGTGATAPPELRAELDALAHVSGYPMVT